MKKMALISLTLFLLALAAKVYLGLTTDKTPILNSDPVVKIVPKKLSPTKAPIKFIKKAVPKKPAKIVKVMRPITPKPVKPVEGEKIEEAREIAVQDEEGNIYVSTIVVTPEGELVANGDLIIGSSEEIEDFQTGKKIPMIKKPKIWEKNIIPFEVEAGLTNEAEIKKAIAHYVEKTNIKFKARTNEVDYVLFRKGTQNCYSALGRIGGKQNITLSPNCSSGEIIHEVMHALGFLHEQSRTDRNQYVQILWENIDEKHWQQFQRVKSSFLNQDAFDFDFNSIMLYPPTTFSKYPGDYALIKVSGDIWEGNRSYLSEEDIRKIRSVYPKEK